MTTAAFVALRGFFCLVAGAALLIDALTYSGVPRHAAYSYAAAAFAFAVAICGYIDDRASANKRPPCDKNPTEGRQKKSVVIL